MLLITALAALPAFAAIPLDLSRKAPRAASVRHDRGVYHIDGAGPVYATPRAQPAAQDRVLEFEYFSLGGVPSFAVLPGPPFQGATARRVPALGHSETWTTWAAKLDADKPLPEGWAQLRLDLPLPAGTVLQIRNARIRAEIPGEFEPKRRQSKTASERVIDAYLATSFPTAIRQVTVGKDAVSIAGSCSAAAGPYFLADIPMNVVLGEPRAWETLLPIQPSADGSFRSSFPRQRQRGRFTHDRLLSRWQIVRKQGDVLEAVSHARHADDVTIDGPIPPPARLANKKGLGGWRRGILSDELEELGIASITVNLVMQHFVSLKQEPGTIPFTWQGRTWFARQSILENYDQTFREAARHKVMVSAILLVGNPAKSKGGVLEILGMPDAAKEGSYAMPDVTSDEGAALYGGILNLIAGRWSRADGKYGRVHHWIVHNEVDAAAVWTNAGDKTALEFMDLYVRSMRMVDLIARQYDPHARAFISLTHHWAHHGNPGWYGSRNLLEILGRFTRAEGDFPWALAYHPYPQSLMNPRTWEDHQATYSYDSPKITPKNLEVLDAWMKEPARLYRGAVRPVHLSENGFNSRDYSPQQLEDQAAGMAYAWKKIERLSSIEAWHYHNWIDNRSEGGLRKFPDEPGDPLGKKPIWHLYQSLGTPGEDFRCAPYLRTIGLSSWDTVRKPNPIQR
jgi:hypothetical protein